MSTATAEAYPKAIVAAAAAERRSTIRRLLDFVFGYDFFISYAWSDGRIYAEALARRLETNGYDVFLDRDDYAVGDDWKKVGAWTLRRTGQLILVGSPDACRSAPVAHEVELFAETRRQIVPIDFDGSLECLDPATPLGRHIVPERLRINEPARALAAGPSDETLASLRRTFTLTRQDKKRVRVLAIVAAVLAALALAAGAFGLQARISERRAQDATDRAEQSLEAEQQERARAERNESEARAAAVRERNARERETAALKAEQRQREIADDRRRFAEAQQRIAEEQRRIAQEQRRAAEMRQLAAESGQRFTQGAAHFASADAADSAGDVESLRRRELREQLAALRAEPEAANPEARALRLRNLEAELAETDRRLGELAQEAARERSAGEDRVAEGRTLWARVETMGGAGTAPAPVVPQLPGLFGIEVLSVGFGQSLILHYGSPDAPRFVLIDGGRRHSYRDALAPRLESLRERWRPGGPLPLELVAISNEDDDRLSGLMEMFEQMLDRRAQGLGEQVKIERLWHNSFGPTIANARWQEMLARAQIEQLGIPFNTPFDRLAMRPERGRLTIPLADGLTATILHPTEAALRDLFRKWQRDVRRRNNELSAPLDFPEERFSALAIAPPTEPRWSATGDVPEWRGELLRRDTSPPNLASLVLLFEYRGRRFLHTGDALDSQILAGLDAAGLLDENGRIDVDLLLLPHMGSDRNISPEFFQRVRARRYLFTGDGTHGNPETSTLEMLFEARRGECVELWFVNRDGRDDLGPKIDAFFAGRPEGADCFRRIFRLDTRNALIVDLHGRVRY